MTGPRPRVLVLGTLDTKGEEFQLLRDELCAAGCEPIVLDMGIMGTPLFPGDIPRETVVERAGRSIESLGGGDRRADAIASVIAGASAIARELYDAGGFAGIIGMGGGSGTTMSSAVMEELPFGVPKLIVTTLSRLQPHIRGVDIVVVRSLVDLVGVNPITRMHIRQAAGAMAGMVALAPEQTRTGKSVVITCLGVTTPAVMRVRELLLARGKDVIVLHRRTHAMDTLLDAGLVEAMLDLTPNEITEGMIYPPGADDRERLQRVRAEGVPLILAPGALDMLLYFGQCEQRPPELADRVFVVHSRDATLIRTTVDEQRRLGCVLGAELRHSSGPVAALVPMRGFSMWDASGRPFDQPEARRAFLDGLLSTAGETLVLALDHHINDHAFADAVVTTLLDLLGEETR